MVCSRSHKKTSTKRSRVPDQDDDEEEEKKEENGKLSFGDKRA